MIELLAALSASASVGLRVALPLLLIGFLSGDNLWSGVPILSHIPPAVVLGTLVSWSLFELIASKDRLWQRILQTIQLISAPFVGAIVGIVAAHAADISGWIIGLVGLISSLLALVLQLVQIGWFYRLSTVPLWAIFLEDFLCVCLIFFAFDAPQQGGIIALLLLWLAIRSSNAWRRWYLQQASPKDRKNPRRYKRNPD
ncbi:MAG: DUF4126 domain-containing protein [Cyanothece sp. SIO1E1]|nr:DUF4126 domain-containing protein [Cyanothece sp. SIO1E1]